MRKLATAALGFATAVFLSRYALSYGTLIYAAAGALMLSPIGLLLRGNARTRALCILIAMAAGFAWSFAHTAIYIEPFWKLHEQATTIKATVAGYPVAREPRGYYTDALLENPLDERGGKRRQVKARLYYYNEAQLAPGDEIEAAAKLYRADMTSEGEQYDTFVSKGIFLTGSVTGEIKITKSATSSDTSRYEGGIKYLPSRLARSVADKIDAIYQADTAAFVKALLTGNREALNKNEAATAALSASGIIHVVAVSGMHVSFLMGFLGSVIKNKFLFALYGIPLLLLFMAMTGFTPAVTRAGVMQIFLICAPLFRRESDNITSLSAAMLALLIANPYSCASIGLQLSFAATLGIILFTPKMNSAVSDFLRAKKLGRKKALAALASYVSSGLAATFGALVFTLPLSAFHFGYISLISPITNIFTIGVLSLTFPLGLLSVIAGFINEGLGAALALPATLGARYILFVARSFAWVPFSVAYSSQAHIMCWLAYVYVMFIMLPLLKARLRQYIYPVCISIILLFAVILASLLMPGAPPVSVTALDIGQGSCTVLTIEGSTVVVDCGSLSKNNAGQIAHEFLSGIGRTNIDILALTHFHDDHINGVEFLLSRTKVGALVIPDPEGSFAAQDIIELARRGGTDIIYVTQTLVFQIGESELMVYPPLGSGDENERGLSFLFLGSPKTLITGDMNSTVERTLLRYVGLPKLDLLVVGHHGSKDSSSEELLQATQPDIAIISVGKNSFGHPHPDALRRLSQIGAAIYRTDEMGHVTITS